MASKNNVEIHLKRLSVLREQIISTKDSIATVTATTVSVSELEVVIEKLVKHEDKLTQIHDELVDLCTEAQFKEHNTVLEPCFNAISKAKSKAMELKRTKLHNETLPVANTQAPAHQYSFKLDNIRLPQFNGKQTEWLCFHDLFVTSVHNNVSLSGAEKLIHLKSALTGDALHVVASYPATDSNYIQAWSSLLARYNNNREIIFSLISDFVHLKVIKEESASGLRHLSDSLNECVRSLKVLNVPVDHWDLIMIFHGVEKLDLNSRREWSLKQTNELPKLSEFIEFLEVRARALLEVAKIARNQSTNSSNSNSQTQSGKSRSSSHHSSTSKLSCSKCNDAHVLSKCKVFKNMNVKERRDFVYKNRICYNCLVKGHTLADCTDKQMCKTCGRKHNTLLHFEYKRTEQNSESNTNDTTEQPGPSQTQTLSSHSTASSKLVLLGTIVASCKSAHGVEMDCRVFLDPGSESNFISENCVSRLGLTRKKTCVKVIGIGGASNDSATGIVEVTLYSKQTSYKISLSALVLKRITMDLPSAECKSEFQHIKGLPLADPQFFRPGKVDILLGAQVAGLIMLPGLKIGRPGMPTAQNSQFGWFLSGAVESSSVVQRKVFSHHSQCTANDACIESSLNKFWEIEEAELDTHTSKEDIECELHFEKTHVRNNDGTYTVELPFKADHLGSPNYDLGKSRDLAVKRFLRVEQRLSSTPRVKTDYIASINESIALGFMEKVPIEELDNPHYYMPHREVVKESSATTKVRIVYDASSKTSSSLSLNDVLMTGPKLQVDLVSLLIRFRSHRIVLIADIQKFYNQFFVNKSHTDFQRLIWRESPDLPLEDYRFTRVTFGVTSAPYLAIRCLHQLAEDCTSSSQLKEVLKEDFLVDNLLTGTHDVESALKLQQELLFIMSKGKLKLRQWSSNCEEALLFIPEEDRELSSCLTISESDIVKTIGIQWFPKTDSFGVKISPMTMSPITKRSVLSLIARIFDPLGWLTPFTVKFKILMQELWKDELPWDSELSIQHCKTFDKYCFELNDLVGYKIPRCITPLDRDNCSYELHGFCDASEDAYAACVYLRTVFSSDESETKLICSKSKVAPLKQITIPRLELCGALLLAKLMKTVNNSLKFNISSTRAWTDSTIVLGWLSTDRKLPIFEANRVRKINEIISCKFWFHVAGTENPADCASRGVSVQQFIDNKLWLNGPQWLYTYKCEDIETSTALPARVESNSVLSLINKCSSFMKMQRVIAYCLRFRNNCSSSVKQTGALTLAELNRAQLSILLSVQREVFLEEFSNSENLSRSKLKSLSPFIDTDGLLKVGGRLQKSEVEVKHPILLPKNHHLTEVIVRYYHQDNLHCGPRLLLALMRQKYWVIRGIDVAKACVRACMTCFKQSSKTIVQQMGQLPKVRVTQARPFSNTGVDYAGPFVVSLRTGRKPPQQKSYIALFVCMCTKAIHLELVSDLSTQAFLAALSRFTARRGLPSNIYCDGGKNFVGAANEIKAVQSLVSSDLHQNLVSQSMAEKGVKFNFNPPLAPHHGGLWEAGVKSMKFHFKRVVGDTILTVEEFTTLLARIESCLNSRPLTQLSNDPNEFEVLTPAHFLIGSTAQCVPESDLTHLKVNHLTRWQLTQQLFQHIWKRWSLEYLNTLQQHHKWHSTQPNISVGQLVHLHDDHVGWGPLNWKLARVVNVYPGSDGKVRVVELKLSTGSVLRRPITRLAPLPIIGNQEF